MVQPIAKTDSEFIGVNPSLPRQTPKTKSAKFSEAVKKGSAILLQAVGSASTVIPGGGFLTAAVRMGQGMETAGALTEKTGGLALGEDPKVPGGSAPGLTDMPENEFSDYWRLQQEGQLMNMEFLKIQESVARENRVFSTLSNVMKARHETTRNAINNIR